MRRKRTRFCCHRSPDHRYDCNDLATHAVIWIEILADGQPMFTKRLCERHARSLTLYLRRVASAPSSVRMIPLDSWPGIE